MAFYFDNNPKSKSKENLIHANINGNVYTFYTDNDVFSKKRLDYGTRVLLENIDLDDFNGNVLDFGCGYGPIGIYIKKNTSATVDMIDVNNRAISLSKKNAKLNNVLVNIFESNIYDNVKNKYDVIITNPPIRVGKKILYEILFKANEYLKDGGLLYLVINKDQGAKSLKKDLEEQYLVTTVCKSSGFYVYKCQKH